MKHLKHGLRLIVFLLGFTVISFVFTSPLIVPPQTLASRTSAHPVHHYTHQVAAFQVANKTHFDIMGTTSVTQTSQSRLSSSTKVFLPLVTRALLLPNLEVTRVYQESVSFEGEPVNFIAEIANTGSGSVEESFNVEFCYYRGDDADAERRIVEFVDWSRILVSPPLPPNTRTTVIDDSFIPQRDDPSPSYWYWVIAIVDPVPDPETGHACPPVQ